MRKRKPVEVPELETIEAELKRTKYQSRYFDALRTTVYTLIVVAAIACLAATLWLPFLRIYGTSMVPTLQDGEIICCFKTTKFSQSDIIAFYYNNKILVKRVIGCSGDWIQIDENGAVYVNDIKIEEPYLTETAFGECDIEMPYQVPEGQLFVMGDQRSTSIDSRHSSVGCVTEEQIVGKILVRLWPPDRLNIFG